MLPHPRHTPKLPVPHTLDSQTTLSGACGQVFCAPAPRSSGGAHPRLPPGTHAALRGGQALGAPGSSSSASWPEAPISGGRSGPPSAPRCACAERGAPSESQAGRPLPAPRHTRSCRAARGHLGTPEWLCGRQGRPLRTAHALWGPAEGRADGNAGKSRPGTPRAEQARTPPPHRPRPALHRPHGLTCLLKVFHMRPRAARTTAQWRTQYVCS